MLEPTVIQFQAPTDAAYTFGTEDAEALALFHKYWETKRA